MQLHWFFVCVLGHPSPSLWEKNQHQLVLCGRGMTPSWEMHHQASLLMIHRVFPSLQKGLNYELHLYRNGTIKRKSIKVSWQDSEVGLLHCKISNSNLGVIETDKSEESEVSLSILSSTLRSCHWWITTTTTNPLARRA